MFDQYKIGFIVQDTLNCYQRPHKCMFCKVFACYKYSALRVALDQYKVTNLVHNLLWCARDLTDQNLLYTIFLWDFSTWPSSIVRVVILVTGVMLPRSDSTVILCRCRYEKRLFWWLEIHLVTIYQPPYQTKDIWTHLRKWNLSRSLSGREFTTPTMWIFLIWNIVSIFIHV